MRKRNYSKLMGIAAATLSAAVIASPMTARAEGTNENTGVASESGNSTSSSEGTSSESNASGAASIFHRRYDSFRDGKRRFFH